LPFGNYGDFKVTGVLKDLREKSHMKFDALFSFTTLNSLGNKDKIGTDFNSWKSFSRNYTYLLLENKDYEPDLAAQLPNVTKRIFPESETERLGLKLQPLLKINLGLNLIKTG